MFCEARAGWKLVGCMTGRYGAKPKFAGNFAVGIPHYASWIKSVVEYDSDMNGLPDAWEERYGDDAEAMAPTADPDGDAFSNYEEWLADTDPTNGNSHLEITAFDEGSVTFHSSTNREYQIQVRQDLVETNENWAVAGHWLPGEDGQTTRTVSFDEERGFFRVRARR